MSLDLPDDYSHHAWRGFTTHEYAPGYMTSVRARAENIMIHNVMRLRPKIHTCNLKTHNHFILYKLQYLLKAVESVS